MSDRSQSINALRDEIPFAGAPGSRFWKRLQGVREVLRKSLASLLNLKAGGVVGFLVIFSPLIDGGTTQLPMFIIRLTLLASLVVWLFRSMKEGRLVLLQDSLGLCILLFALWTTLSLAWSPYKNPSVQWILTVFSYTLLFAFVTHGIRSTELLKVQVRLVMGVGVLEALVGIVQFLWLNEERARGTFFNPNFFAIYEGAVLALMLGRLILPGQNKSLVATRGWIVGSGIVVLIAFVMAQSRGALIALFGALSILCFARFGLKALMAVIVCAALVGLVPNPLMNRLIHVGSVDPYAYTRVDIWKNAAARIIDQPFGIGVGMYKQGSFEDRFPIEGSIIRYWKRPESAHNEYLQIGVELGIVGLIILLGGLGVWFREASQLLRQRADSGDQGLVFGLVASVIALLLHAAVDSTFHEPALVIMLIILAGLVHNSYLLARPDRTIWKTIVFQYHPIRVMVIVLGWLLMTSVFAQSWLAWYAHEEGKREARLGNPEHAMTWYLRAGSIDPGITGYHDSAARTALELFKRSGDLGWLLQASEEELFASRLNPLDGRFAYRLGTIYCLMATQASAALERKPLLQKASEEFREAIRRDPYSPFSYFELAKLLADEGEVNDAIALLKTATSHEPNFLPGRVFLAELSLRAGIPGNYRQEYAVIKEFLKSTERRELADTEKQFLQADLTSLERVLTTEMHR